MVVHINYIQKMLGNVTCKKEFGKLTENIVNLQIFPKVNFKNENHELLYVGNFYGFVKNKIIILISCPQSSML